MAPVQRPINGVNGYSLILFAAQEEFKSRVKAKHVMAVR
jgi:hypothetical protein